jgi:hypothetical protein
VVKKQKIIKHGGGFDVAVTLHKPTDDMGQNFREKKKTSTVHSVDAEGH